MRLNEFVNKENLPFDPVEDAVFFMRNNPQFYRKEVFPCICKAKDDKKVGKFTNAEGYLSDCVNKGLSLYKQKYDMQDAFKDDDKGKIIDLLFNEEMR